MGRACRSYGGEERCVQGFGRENLRVRDYFEDPDVDDRIILRWVFRMWNEVHGLDLSGSGQGHVAGKGGNEPSGSIKCREFLD